MGQLARALILTSVGTVLIGCSGGGDGSGVALHAPFFDRPFDADFPVANMFDHDVPLSSANSNGYAIDHNGTRRSIGEPGAAADGHDGYDWAMPSGTEVKAVADGDVVFAGDNRAAPCPLLPGSPVVAAKIVTILHTAPNGDSYLSSSGHFSTVVVSTGANVRAGEVIGLSGNTGCSSGPHLHLEVHRWVGARWIVVDPYGWTPETPDPWSLHREGTTSVPLWKAGQAPALVPQ